MRRIIAHSIRGDAKNAHEALTKDLADKFDSFPIHERISPHLSLKRWFELDEQGMEALCKTLDAFVATRKQSNYKLSGFGHFGKEVIYMDVVPSKETLVTVKDLKTELHKIEKLTFDEFDDLENDLHATLVFGALKPFDFDPIWEYLEKIPQPNFNMKFDNITIFKKLVNTWEVERAWELKP